MTYIQEIGHTLAVCHLQVKFSFQTSLLKTLSVLCLINSFVSFKSTFYMKYNALNIVVVTYYHLDFNFKKMSPRELSLILIFPNKSQKAFIFFTKISLKKTFMVYLMLHSKFLIKS